MENDDRSWIALEGTWERLRWARARKFDTATDAARSFGIKEGTYLALERAPTSSKHTRLDVKRAEQIGKRLGVRWQWLLRGDGSPFEAGFDSTRLGRAIHIAKQKPPEEQERIAAIIELSLR